MRKSGICLQGLGLVLLMSTACAVIAETRNKTDTLTREAKEFPGFAAAAGQKRALNIGTGPSFATEIHVDIVMNTPEAKACSEVLARAQWRQDILLALSPSAHYDNCQFDATTTYLQDQIEVAIVAGTNNNRDDALSALGRALHAIQDFYAHTNYVELAVGRFTNVSEIPVLPVWTVPGKTELQRLVASGLVSGYVWWEPQNICKSPVKTHDLLNKDAPTSASGQVIVSGWNQSQHQVARDLARRATLEFLRDAFSKPQLANVAAQCKGQIGVLLLTDNRNHE